ncbi:MAG TPA: nuclear transport factor 2 family protein [Phycisphaerales bacterium]|nr:nuclear transport factor 2 family protein [Phycisphaerales bacterium]
MPLSPQEMDRRLDEHFGFEAADDVEGVVATLAPDASHDIVGYPTGPTRGRDRAREFYRQMFSDLSESRVTSLKRLYGENFMIDESMWEGRAPGRPFGLDGRDRPLKFRILHVLEFTPDGRHIQREQVWLDMAAIIQQLPQD